MEQILSPISLLPHPHPSVAKVPSQGANKWKTYLQCFYEFITSVEKNRVVRQNGKEQKKRHLTKDDFKNKYYRNDYVNQE